MASHEGLDAAKELPPNENGRDLLLGVSGELVKHGLNVVGGDMVVELDDCGAHTESEEEAFGDCAHAAPAHAEHHHRVAAPQLPHHLVRRAFHLHCLYSLCFLGSVLLLLSSAE